MQLLLDTQRRSVVVAPQAQLTYQPGSSLIASAGVAIPSTIESRMPGIEVRYSVSWIALQSSSERSMALTRLP